MSEQRLLCLIGQIDDGYLEDVHADVHRDRRGVWLRWGTLAACVCLMVTALFIFWPKPSDVPLFDGSKDLTITVWMGGGFDGPGTDHKVEFSTLPKTEKNPQAKPYISGNINGESYRVEYKDSTIRYRWQGNTDNYKNEDMKISVNQDTGNIDFYHKWDNIRDKDIGRDNCFLKAQQYLSEYVDDALEYSLICEERYDPICRYQFWFAKIVNGVRLSKVRIGVSFAGELTLHDFTELGCVREEELPSQENMANIEAAVDMKMQAVYGEEYVYEYEFVDVVFLRLADGTYAMQYDIAADMTPKSYPHVTYTPEIIRMFVLLE
jgi:hypothetical protein